MIHFRRKKSLTKPVLPTVVNEGSNPKFAMYPVVLVKYCKQPWGPNGYDLLCYIIRLIQFSQYFPAISSFPQAYCVTLISQLLEVVVDDPILKLTVWQALLLASSITERD